MEKELINSVIKKQFIELTQKERTDLKEWCATEEEFEQLKSVFKGVEQMKLVQTDVPRTETKRSLDDLFAQKHAKVAPTIWYNSILVALYPTEKPMFQRPILQIAAIGLVLLMVYPFLFKNELDIQKPQLAKVETAKEKSSSQEVKEDNNSVSGNQEIGIAEEQSTKSPIAFEDVPMLTLLEDVSANDKMAEMDAETAGAVSYAWTAAPAVSDHPDGIYIGASTISYSQSASDQPAVLDLLTATF
jgi:hypothetical protein